MRKILFILFIAFFSNLQAQQALEVVTTIMPPYPSQVSDFLDEVSSNATITVINSSDRSFNFYLRASFLQTDGNVSVTLREDLMPTGSQSIDGFQTVTLSLEDLEVFYASISTDDIETVGVARSLNAQLPGGTYQLCIEVLSFDNPGIALGPLSCSNEFEVSHGNIQLLQPENESVVSSDAQTNFVWTNMSANASQQDNDYRLNIYEVPAVTAQNESIHELIYENGIAPYYQSDLTDQTNWLFDNTVEIPALEEGKQYAAQVNYIDNANTDNQGASNINTFWYGSRPEGTDEDGQVAEIPDLPEDCESRCNIVPLENQSVGNLESFSEIALGYFRVTDLIVVNNGGSYSGTGKIVVDFLFNASISVELIDIKVNTQGQVIEGYAKAITEEVPGAEDAFDALNLGVLEPYEDYALQGINSAVTQEQLNTAGEAIRNARMIRNLVTGGDVGMPLGISQSVGGNDLTLAITAMTFTHEKAKCRILAGFPVFMFDREQWVLFEAADICLHPQGFGGEYTIKLGKNLELGKDEDKKYMLTFNGGFDNEDACFMEMNCNGLSKLQMKGDISLSRKLVLPDSSGLIKDKGRVNASFSLEMEKTQEDVENEEENTIQPGMHWIANLNFEDAFQIKGLDGYSFSINDAYLDMSDIHNPDATFPENYQLDESLFRGILVSNISMQAPPSMHRTENRISANVDDFLLDLVDDPLLYMKVNAQNLIQPRDGAIQGWQFTMDTIQLEIEANQLTKGTLDGKISTPLQDSGVYFNYDANLSYIESSKDTFYGYGFNISPSENLDLNLLVSTAELYSTSYIDLTNHKDGEKVDFQMDLFLDGLLNIDVQKFVAKLNKTAAAHINMKGVKFNVAYNTETGFDTTRTSLGFASPTKFINNLPVNLTKLKLGTSGENVTIDLGASLQLGEGESAPAVTAEVQFNSTLKNLSFDGISQETSEVKNQVKKFSLDSLSFQRIELNNVNFKGFSLDGYIEFYNNALQAEGGTPAGRDKGIKGGIRVEVGMMAAELVIESEIQFGTYGTPPENIDNLSRDDKFSADYYPYFMFYGSLQSSVGIPIPAPVFLNGFSGGFSVNMAFNSQASNPDDRFTPSYEEYWFKAGINAKVAEAAELDLSFQCAFSKNQGLTMMNVTGLGAFMPKPDADGNMTSSVTAGFGITYLPRTETRSAYLSGELIAMVNLDIGAGYIKGVKGGNNTFNGEVQENVFVRGNLFVDSASNSWFFHMGKAHDLDERGKMEVCFGCANDSENARGMRAQLEVYLMVGDSLPTTLPPLPDAIVRLLNGASEDAEDAATSDTRKERQFDSPPGEGFAMGAHFAANAEIKAFIIQAYLNAYVGFDINITKSNLQCANLDGDRTRGINGWYGQGQAYAGIEGGLNLRFKVFGKERLFSLAEFGCAVSITAGLPRPAYFIGQAGVRFRFLNGLIKGRTSFKVQIGEACQIINPDPLAGINFFKDFDPANNSDNVFVGKRPEIGFTLPLNRTFEIVEEQIDGDNGTVSYESRYFKPFLARKTLSLERRNGSNKAVQISTRFNSRKDVMTMIPKNVLREEKEYKIYLKIQAYEYIKGSPKLLTVDDKTWFVDTTIHFETDEHPNDLYRFARNSNPRHGQRFYIPFGPQILITGAFNVDKVFYPGPDVPIKGSSSETKSLYSYYLRLKDGQNTPLKLIPFDMSYLTTENTYTKIDLRALFSSYNFSPRKMYRWEIIRRYDKRAAKPNLITQVNQSRIIDPSGLNLDLSTNFTIGYEDNTNNIYYEEELIYHSDFKTSIYQTWEEKLSSYSPRHINGLKFSLGGEDLDPIETHPYQPLSSDYHGSEWYEPRFTMYANYRDINFFLFKKYEELQDLTRRLKNILYSKSITRGIYRSLMTELEFDYSIYFKERILPNAYSLETNNNIRIPYFNGNSNAVSLAHLTSIFFDMVAMETKANQAISRLRNHYKYSYGIYDRSIDELEDIITGLDNIGCFWLHKCIPGKIGYQRGYTTSWITDRTVNSSDRSKLLNKKERIFNIHYSNRGKKIQFEAD